MIPLLVQRESEQQTKICCLPRHKNGKQTKIFSFPQRESEHQTKIFSLPNAKVSSKQKFFRSPTRKRAPNKNFFCSPTQKRAKNKNLFTPQRKNKQQTEICCPNHRCDGQNAVACPGAFSLVVNHSTPWVATGIERIFEFFPVMFCEHVRKKKRNSYVRKQ